MWPYLSVSYPGRNHVPEDGSCVVDDVHAVVSACLLWGLFCACPTHPSVSATESTPNSGQRLAANELCHELSQCCCNESAFSSRPTERVLSRLSAANKAPSEKRQIPDTSFKPAAENRIWFEFWYNSRAAAKIPRDFPSPASFPTGGRQTHAIMVARFGWQRFPVFGDVGSFCRTAAGDAALVGTSNKN